MRKKLNQSVDVASLQARRDERAKRRYVDTKLYNDVSNIMNFDAEKFEKNVEQVLEPFTNKNRFLPTMTDINVEHQQRPTQEPAE